MGQDISKYIDTDIDIINKNLENEIEKYKIQCRILIHDHYTILLKECKKQIEYEKNEYYNILKESNYKNELMIL